MKPAPQAHRYWVSLILVTGAVLTFLYAGGYLIVVPYIGFLPIIPDGEITDVFVNEMGPAQVLVGDRLISGGSQTWQEFVDNPEAVLFQGAQAGQNYLVVVERMGERVSLEWEFPGFTREEFIYRLRQPWWVPLILLCGAIGIFLFARPRNKNWYLLTIFFALLSSWLAAGIVSHTQIYYSRYVSHFLVWILVAVAWHFHWIFPAPLAKLPRSAGWILYIVCTLIAVVEMFTGLSLPVMYLGVLFLAIGIVGMLYMHAVRQKERIAEIRLLLGGFVLAFTPSILFLLLDSTEIETGLLYIPVLLMYGVLPISYIYAIYYHRLGGMELRANRAIVVLIYAVFLFMFTLAVGLILRMIQVPDSITLTILAFLFVTVGLLSPFLYPKIQLWFNRQIFGINLPPGRLFEGYANWITTSLDKEHLAQVLGKQIFPSLMIRQAALIGLEQGASDNTIRQIVPIFLMDIPDNWLPCAAEIPLLAQQAGNIRMPGDSQQLCPWARLVFALGVEERLIGLCLLGRRDPDDYYSPSEIPSLQALMDQTALALLNIEQAENLRILYQINIDRQEAEQLRLARLLHDEVLSQMALLAQYADPSKMDPKFNLAYQTSVEYIRDIIAGLRPATLNFGLHVALEELVFEYGIKTSARGNEPHFIFNIPESPIRYPGDVELHLYRIIQQAMNNALSHARAHAITLDGCLESDFIRLTVRDDGVGFPQNTNMEIAGLLSMKHYGLAGMHERAAIIGALLQIDSRPGLGTGINIVWGTHR